MKAEEVIMAASEIALLVTTSKKKVAYTVGYSINVRCLVGL